MTSPFLVSRTSGSIHPTALSSSWMKLSGSRPGLMEKVSIPVSGASAITQISQGGEP